MRFRHRPIEVDVIQWLKPGDHPAEREAHPMLPESARCHLVIQTPNGTKDVHRGDYILTFEDGTHDVLTREELHRLYEPAPISHGHHYHEHF